MFSMLRLLTSHSNNRWTAGATYRTFGQKVKGQPSGDSLGAIIFWQDIWTHLRHSFFLLCTQTQYDERKIPRKFKDKLSLIKDSKGRCPIALDDFADFSVLCQVVRFTFAVCYQFLVIFLCFGIFPFDRTSFFTFIIPGSRDIVQVVQTIQIDLQIFCFTASGSNLAFVLKNIAHDFYKMQKGNVIAFYKIIQ